MCGRLPGCCCPEWTVSPASSGRPGSEWARAWAAEHVCSQLLHLNPQKAPHTHTCQLYMQGKMCVFHVLPVVSRSKACKVFRENTARSKQQYLSACTHFVCCAFQNGWLLLCLKETGCCLYWGKVPAGFGLPHAQLWTHRLGKAGCQPARAGWYQQHEWAG